jgi:hypothetical protein
MLEASLTAETALSQSVPPGPTLLPGRTMKINRRVGRVLGLLMIACGLGAFATGNPVVGAVFAFPGLLALFYGGIGTKD